MGKSVAVESDVQAVPAVGFALSAPIKVVTDPKLKVGGKAVALSATASFANASTKTVDSVTLTGSGKLQKAAAGVLRDGDSAKGKQGCQLKVTATGKLKVG